MNKANYKERIKLDLNTPVEYPDFTVEYLGDEKHEGKVKWNISGDTAFTYAKYKIKSGDYEKEILWGSGTGEITPYEFVIKGKTFSICGFNNGFQAFEGYDSTGKDVGF